MPDLHLSGITIDAADPRALAAWWGEALGWSARGRVCRPPEGVGQRIEFMPVREAKLVKNRVHFDLVANDVQAEIDRLVAMGATVAWEEDFPEELGYRNVVLQDPEGNEFCVGGPPWAEPEHD